MGFLAGAIPRRAATSLLAVAMLTLSTGPTRAAALTACTAPFTFEGAAANIVPVEYLATSADQAPGQAERLERLQRTAQRLAWLIELDSWHQPTYGSLGVVAHMFLDEQCDPDDILAELIGGGANAPLRPGQILVMLQGRIFIEGDDIFLQSRLRGFRRNDVPPGSVDVAGGYFEGEGLSVAFGEGAHRLHAGLPSLDITFGPRALTFAELDRIDEQFEEASIVYPQPDRTADGEVLRFEPDRPQAFRVQLLDDGAWLKIEDIFGGTSGFIHADPTVSTTLHASLPELDFLNGMLGFLRLSQARDDSRFPPPPESAAQDAHASLARFAASERVAEDAEARALAFALSGAVAAFGNDWVKARGQFLAAADAAPYRGVYRNLLGLAEAMVCCAGVAQADFSDPTRAFTDSLSLSPHDREALLNLDAFLAFLSEAADPPPGIDTSRLAERRAVVRSVVTSAE